MRLNLVLSGIKSREEEWTETYMARGAEVEVGRECCSFTTEGKSRVSVAYSVW